MSSEAVSLNWVCSRQSAGSDSIPTPALPTPALPVVVGFSLALVVICDYLKADAEKKVAALILRLALSIIYAIKMLLKRNGAGESHPRTSTQAPHFSNITSNMNVFVFWVFASVMGLAMLAAIGQAYVEYFNGTTYPPVFTFIRTLIGCGSVMFLNLQSTTKVMLGRIGAFNHGKWDYWAAAIGVAVGRE